MTTLRNPFSITTDDNQARLVAEQARADDMWAPTRGYVAGRIGTDINAALADEASLRAAGDLQGADVAARRAQELQQRQALYAPRVGRVEDIGGVGDFMDWAGTQVGQGVASMQDPVAIAALGQGVGTALRAIPALRGVSRLAPVAGAAGAFAYNQRQGTGEMYGRLKDDPEALAGMSAQDANRMANTYGLAAGALDTLVPVAAGRALGGRALLRDTQAGRALLGNAGMGTRTVAGMVGEGTTEMGQQMLQQGAHSLANPLRDTSGDFSENLNAFAGGAVGGAPFAAVGAAADSVYGRVGDGAQRVTERAGEAVDLLKERGSQAADQVRSRIGDTIDLAKERAPDLMERSGLKAVFDLSVEKGQPVWDKAKETLTKANQYIRDSQGRVNFPEALERARQDVERYRLSSEEFDMLTEAPPEGAVGDELTRWFMDHDARTIGPVTDRMVELENSGVPEASQILDGLLSDDPMERSNALQEATEFLLSRNEAAQAHQKAVAMRAVFGTAIQQGVASATRTAANAALGAAKGTAFIAENAVEGVRQASKKNLQGTAGDGLTHDAWERWTIKNEGGHAVASAVKSNDPEYSRSKQRAITHGEMLAAEVGRDLGDADDTLGLQDFARSLAFEVNRIANALAFDDTQPSPRVLDAIARDFRGLFRERTAEVIARLTQTANPRGQEVYRQLQDRAEGWVKGRSARVRENQALIDKLLLLLPAQQQRELRSDPKAAEDMLDMFSEIARGRVPPERRREVERALGAETFRGMLAAYNEHAIDNAPRADIQTELNQTVDGPNATEQGDTVVAMDDDGATDNDVVGAPTSDFDARQAERKVARNSAPRMYAFYGEKRQSIRSSDDSSARKARNPFEPSKRMSPSEAAKAREAAVAAQLVGDDSKPVIPNARPRLLSIKAEGAKDSLAAKVRQLEETLGVDQTPKNFFRLAKAELKSVRGVAEAAKARKQIERLEALEKQVEEGDAAALARVQEMTERFFLDRAGDYRVDAVSAKTVMDELGMSFNQRLAIFRDYMVQEGQRIRAKDEATAQKYFALARNANAALLDGNMDTNLRGYGENADTPVRSGIAGIKRLQARLTAGERKSLRTAMERYFSDGYLVRAEQLSDRVPGTMSVGELLELARAGSRLRDKVRGEVNQAGAGGAVSKSMQTEVEGQILNFPQREGVNLLGTKESTALAIPTKNLVAWVRANRRQEGADTNTRGYSVGEEQRFLRDLNEGIAALTAMDIIDGLPYVLGPDGERQEFSGTRVPAALNLPNRKGAQFNRSKTERTERRIGEEVREREAETEIEMPDWFVADPLEGFEDNVKYRTVVEAPHPSVGTSPHRRTTTYAERNRDTNHAPVNKQGNRDSDDVTPLDASINRQADDAVVKDLQSRSKDVTKGIGRESPVDAASRAEDRAASVVAYHPGRKEVTGADGRLIRVDRRVHADNTLANVDRRLRAARGEGREQGMATGKHYAYPLAYALSVKNLQDLLNTGEFDGRQQEHLIEAQMEVARILNDVPAGVRLRLAKAFAEGHQKVNNYAEADAFLKRLGEYSPVKVKQDVGGKAEASKSKFTPKQVAMAIYKEDYSAIKTDEDADQFIAMAPKVYAQLQALSRKAEQEGRDLSNELDTVRLFLRDALKPGSTFDWASLYPSWELGSNEDFDARVAKALGWNAAPEVAAQDPKSQPKPGGEAQRNAQATTGSPASDAQIAEAKAYLDRVLGKQIKAEFKEITGYSGEWIDQDNLLRVSTLTNAGIMDVTRHEALHAFFSKFIKANPQAARVLSSLTDDPRVIRRLEILLKDEPEALKQLADGEERLAYIYQFAMAGRLRLPASQGKTMMGKFRKFLRRVFQMVSDQERAADLLYAFEAGKMRDPSAAGRVIAATINQGSWLSRGSKAMGSISQKAAALIQPASTILASSPSKTARRIGELFYTNPGEEKDGQRAPGYLNDRNQQMRRYENVYRGILEGLDARQLEELITAMQRETPVESVTDPDVAAAKEKLHAFFERMYRYMRDEKGLRVRKIRENYFPRVYDKDALTNKPAKFTGMLLEKYASELQEMAARWNEAQDRRYAEMDAKEAAAAPPKVVYTPKVVADELLRRIIGADGVDDEVLSTPLREDGVLRPWMSAGEERKLNFIKPEDIEPFLEKDLFRTLGRYVRQAVRTAEYSARFGRTGARLHTMLMDVSKELEAASHDMLKHGDLKDEKARKKWVEQEYRNVANAVGAMEGSLGNDVSNTVRQLNSWGVVYQNVRLLPLALFSSFVDPLGIIARGGEMREAYEAFVRGIKSVGQQWADMIRDEPTQRKKDRWEHLAEIAGVVDGTIFTNLLHDEYGSVYHTGAARKINEAMFKANGMEAWNRAMRVSATRAAVGFIERHSQGVDKHSARWMRELGLTKGDLYFDDGGNLITDKRTLMNSYPDMDMEVAEQVISKTHSAILRWVEGAILSPNAAQRPAWASDPHYGVFWHLKQFAYSFHETIMKRAVNEAQHGNALPLGVFAWYIPVMIASDVVKGLATGAGDLPNYMKGYDLGDWVQHGVDRSGVLGKYHLLIDGINDPAGIPGPLFDQVVDIVTEPTDKTFIDALPAHALYERML